MSEKYYGNYIGIVISEPSLDPERRNRAQVWVPSITNTLYQGWNNNTQDTKEITKEMMNRLRNSLPWAECASPLIGGGAPFFSNSATGSYDPVPENVVEEEEPLPQLRDPNATVQETEDGPIWSDNGDPLDRFERESYLSAKEQSLVGGNDDVKATLDGSAAAQEATFIRLEESKKLVEWTVPTSVTRLDKNAEPVPPAKDKPEGPLVEQAQGGARNRTGAINNNLLYAITTGLQGTGLKFKITSGSQTGQGINGGQASRPPRASNRHNNGNAADGDFIDIATGTTLNPATNIEDRNRISNAITQLRSAGIKGIGWDYGEKGTARHYMGPERFHLDIVTPETWGANNSAANAADWVIAAAKNGDKLASSSPTSEPDGLPVTDDFGNANSTVPYGGAGTATGTFSTISYLAKVWVFFYGGDIQRPVYFAQVTNPYSITEAFQANPDLLERTGRTV